MRSPLLRPRWLGIHLLALLAVLGCLTLGAWQYERAKEPGREVVTNPVEDLANATDIGATLEPGGYMPQDKANEAVRATGEYDAEAQLLAPSLSPEGEEGYSVIAPLVTESDVAVVVNRGWIPEDAGGPDAGPSALPALPEGEVAVTGWLMQPQDEASKGYSAMSVPEGQIARIAPALLVNEWPYRLYEGYINLAEQDPASEEAGSAVQPRELPPPEPPQEISWNFKNLSYAAQWAVFAVAAAAFWISLVRRELVDRRSGTPEGTQPSAVGAGAD
ncbi:cytochrome oxidase assembly protein ShyY1 [Spinactinospora alkalitolerans]|uniref:SURF1-like protein n=1 Tax=Spinactinospora alkalitolerans TaxID=687207 RepID=A0A852TQ59_9ACTN|nr:SURF1 family protein [Spinactinospora alkalitolerans]NYE44962.1 cytochrome oxidase assembly protein ShyY1 [Spinactinospora alkalitolerans]